MKAKRQIANTMRSLRRFFNDNLKFAQDLH